MSSKSMASHIHTHTWMARTFFVVVAFLTYNQEQRGEKKKKLERGLNIHRSIQFIMLLLLLVPMAPENEIVRVVVVFTHTHCTIV